VHPEASAPSPSRSPGQSLRRSSGLAGPAACRGQARDPGDARGDRRAHELTGILGVYSDPGHIVAYTDGEIRQEWELILLGRPVSGTPTVNDEGSDVRWIAPGDLEALDIHPTQWRQLRDWLARAWPHVD
jgi:8-oxo-dGTP pyrophosphatase MutT (NUDIX family)